MKSFPAWLLFLFTGLLFVLGLFAGSCWIPVSGFFNNAEFQPIIELRLYRMLAALIIGASLSLSGMTFQAVLRNPLAEPFTLGISGGAGVGAALAFILGLKAMGVLMRDFDETYYLPNLRDMREACGGIGHEWRFTHLGPLNNQQFSCAVCGATESR